MSFISVFIYVIVKIVDLSLPANNYDLEIAKELISSSVVLHSLLLKLQQK